MPALPWLCLTKVRVCVRVRPNQPHTSPVPVVLSPPLTASDASHTSPPLAALLLLPSMAANLYNYALENFNCMLGYTATPTLCEYPHSPHVPGPVQGPPPPSVIDGAQWLLGDLPCQLYRHFISLGLREGTCPCTPLHFFPLSNPSCLLPQLQPVCCVSLNVCVCASVCLVRLQTTTPPTATAWSRSPC